MPFFLSAQFQATLIRAEEYLENFPFTSNSNIMN